MARARQVDGAGEKRPRGRPSKLGDVQPFPLRLPVDLHKQLKHYVVDHEGRSLNDIIVEAVQQWWSQVPERDRYARLVAYAAKKAQEK
jgi:hypothetical protein